jgi:hypothetical protein
MINSVRISTEDIAVQNRNYRNQVVSMNWIAAVKSQCSQYQCIFHYPFPMALVLHI